jgi:hypothetical protein
MPRLVATAALAFALAAAPLEGRGADAAAPHPSGRTRIFAAMRWKAEHPETWSRP